MKLPEVTLLPLKPDELETHLTAAGFRDIAVYRDESKHWLCVTAVK